MRLVKLVALAASALILPSMANATLVGSLGGGNGPFLSLSTSGLTDGSGTSIATLDGGKIYTADMPFADIPAGVVFENSFLAAGPQAGQPATLTFGDPTSYLSFLWGSPDSYNILTVTTNLASYVFTADDLGFSSSDGDQSFSQYVQFAGSLGETISAVSFNNAPAQDAFETANYSVTAAVPEPASWAMMVGGFGLIGAALRRRQQVRLTYA